MPRTVEPYLHGISTAGSELIRGYQVAGLSHHAHRGWRLFAVGDMTHVTLSEEPFIVRPEYRPDDQAFISVHCCV
jgi:hypothetical protein